MPAVAFQNVSKSFRRHAGQQLLRERLAGLLRVATHEQFFALKNVSFSIGQGNSLAVIGKNGAGKSTLLNIATGLCTPSAGTVDVNGRVAALLQLGSGFHPDLTGAENVRINAALLGLSRVEVRRRFDAIVEFSEIGDFIDEPLRTYSTGMVMRLAFSVAVNVDPDILIVDEVLGVGDQNFFGKCLDRVLRFRHEGKTILCVSHALDTLELLCNEAIWLDHGQLIKAGPVRPVIAAYTEVSQAQAMTC
jgi:ABC-type polysaccharide/polyol phosphate transport system ATPase subunit